MFAYILFEEDLVSRLRQETKGAFLNNPRSPDIQYLEEKCPNLNAVWNETLRLSAYSSSVRYIMEDTIVGGKTLRKGNRVMIPNRQLHFNHEIFGEDVDEFKPTRFVNNSKRLQSRSWKPFGGGSTICPGRFIAKQAVISFVTMIIHRFDIDTVGEKKFPEMEDGNPVLGIMSAKANDDLRIKLTRRE
jgi:cytochrome P450